MRKGSITLYLCLILGCMLSLICAGLFSARHATARVVLSSAAEQGMFSLFSRYDRTLFDDYGILAIDGGYGGAQLKLGALQNEAEEIVEFLTGNSSDLAGPSNLMHFSMERGEVTGYMLLTDQNGAVLQEQIQSALIGKITASVLQSRKEQLTGNLSTFRELEKKGESIDVDEVEKEYRDLQQEETTETVTSLLVENTSGEIIQTERENPIEMILGLRKLGVLNLVIPKGRTVSPATIEDHTVSNRTLQKGMGIVPADETGLKDKALILEYLMGFFDDFTEAKEEVTSGLKYQVEYAVGGKDSDQENLKSVLNQLLAVREASNYVYLLQDSVKQKEVLAMASSICALLCIPAAEPVVAEMLRFCWAFGESVLDLRVLLKGGKIPLVKTKESWQLSLNMLSHIQEELTEEHSSEDGLDYQWYLRMLLALKDEKELTYSVMDLIEHTIRKKEGREEFRLDNCLVSMKILFRARQDNLFVMEAERSYNYTQ